MTPALLACVLVAAACAKSGDAGGGSTSLSAYLGQLPAPAPEDGGDVILVNYADLARASEIAGVERPDDPGDNDAIQDWLAAVTGYRETGGHAVAALPPTTAQIERSAEMEAFVDDVGWSILEVDSYAERDTPPGRVAVLDGHFDRGRLADTLDDAGDGVWVAGDPEAGIDPDGITPARPLGQPLWFTLGGQRLRVSGTENDVDPEGDTLADDAALAALAGALEDHDVYTAMLAAGGPLGLDAAAEEIRGRGELPLGPRCEGLTGAGVGVADDGDPLIVLALSQASGSQADANASVVEDVLRTGDDVMTDRPWSDIVTVESVEVEDGVVVATLRPAEMVLGGWRAFLYTRAFPPC
jgi:hypothetical protein